MIICILLLLLSSIESNGKHFNGGTIRWVPVDPYDNSSLVPITIIQTYSWTYPTISCAANVPISTPGRSNANANLTCIADCTTDGNYSVNPVNILTDCVSASSTLNMMTSERSVNTTIGADSHFYISYQDSAWTALNSPAQSGLYWSITSYIDLRMRPDGFINTPPEVSFVSPRYVVVNTTTEIQIPVSDVNPGDDVRCRWSQYIPGYRRKREADQTEDSSNESDEVIEEILFEVREKRGSSCSWCSGTCDKGCCCKSSACSGTACYSKRCGTDPVCPLVTTITETPGTLPTTISYATRQAIDECGSICYPSGLPNGTTLTSNCTLTFTGLVPNTWYAISLQVS